MLNVGDIVTIKTQNEIIAEYGNPSGKSMRLSYMSCMSRHADGGRYEVEFSCDCNGESQVKLRSIEDYSNNAGGFWYEEYMLIPIQPTTYELFSESDIKALFGA